MTAQQLSGSRVISGGRRKIDAVWLLTLWLVLLLAIPQRLVLAPVGAAGGPATLLAGLLLCVYLVAWLHPSFSIDHGRQPLRLALALLTCAMLVSYIAANTRSLSTLALNGADRAVIFLFGWVGITLLAADGIDSVDRLKTLIRRLVLLVTAEAVLGIVQFFTGLDAAQYIKVPGLAAVAAFTDLSAQRGGLNRPSATALQPLELGAILVIVLSLAIHQARFAPPGMRFRRWLQVALIALAATMTLSRSAILGIIVCLIVVLSVWPRKHRWIAYGAVAAAVAFMFVTIHGLLGTLSGLFINIGSDSSTVSRTGAFSQAAPLISAHPWLGMGLGTFTPQTYFFTDDQYLGTLIETGFVGFAALLILFATGWCVARGARRISANAEMRHLAQCLAASVLVAAVTFFTFDALSFVMAAGVTFLVLGCAGAAWRLARQEQRSLDERLHAADSTEPQPIA